MSEWIAVTERTPNESGNYLICEDGEIDIAYWGIEDQIFVVYGFHGDSEKIKPTHWMPLPRPPSK